MTFLRRADERERRASFILPSRLCVAARVVLFEICDLDRGRRAVYSIRNYVPARVRSSNIERFRIDFGGALNAVWRILRYFVVYRRDRDQVFMLQAISGISPTSITTRSIPRKETSPPVSKRIPPSRGFPVAVSRQTRDGLPCDLLTLSRD